MTFWTFWDSSTCSSPDAPAGSQPTPSSPTAPLPLVQSPTAVAAAPYPPVLPPTQAAPLDEPQPAPQHDEPPRKRHKRFSKATDVAFVCGWNGCNHVVPDSYVWQDEHMENVHGIRRKTDSPPAPDTVWKCQHGECQAARAKGAKVGECKAWPQLLRHYRATHQKPGSYVCWSPTCAGHQYSRLDAYQRHLRDVHGAAADPVAGPSGHTAA